jgi:uncharacterized membrane protein YkvA (DUF1232 family)
VDAGTVVGIVAGILVVWALLIGLLWILRPRDVGLRDLVAVVPDVLRLVRNLLADGSVPVGVRLALAGLLVWLLSPIDLIPEFVPVLGPLDDVVVAVLVLRYVARRLGLAELRRRWQGSDAGFDLLARLVARPRPVGRG